MPREMSSGESSPAYEPSHPATASTSTPYAQRISLAIAPPPSIVASPAFPTTYSHVPAVRRPPDRALGRRPRRPPRARSADAHGGGGPAWLRADAGRLGRQRV